MQEVEITQFMLPHGDSETHMIEIAPAYQERVAELVEAGYTFEFEVLATGQGSATLCDKGREMDVGCTISTRAEMEQWMEEHTDVAEHCGSNIACLFHRLIDETYPQWEKSGKPKVGTAWANEDENKEEENV